MPKMIDVWTVFLRNEEDGGGTGAPGAADPKPADAAPPADTKDTPADAGTDAPSAKAGGEGDKSPDLLADAGVGDKAPTEGSADDKSTAAPEAYEYTPPDGIEIDEEMQGRLTAFGEFAKGMDTPLSQEQYQAVIDYHNKVLMDGVEADASAYDQRVDAWGKATVADTEIGGEGGAALDANLAVARRAMNKFGTPELGQLLGVPGEQNPNGLGLGKHPEVIRFLVRVGKTLGEPGLEDSADTSTGSDAKDADAELRAMYPSMFPKQ